MAGNTIGTQIVVAPIRAVEPVSVVLAASTIARPPTTLAQHQGVIVIVDAMRTRSKFDGRWGWGWGGNRMLGHAVLAQVVVATLAAVVANAVTAAASRTVAAPPTPVELLQRVVVNGGVVQSHVGESWLVVVGWIELSTLERTTNETEGGCV